MLLKEHLVNAGRFLFRWRSYTPLLAMPLLLLKMREFRGTNNVFLLMGGLLALAGLILRVMTIGYVTNGTSGRNTKKQKASSLNTAGIYSITRNPLYLGNYLICLGITLTSQSWEIVLISSLGFGMLYLPVILCEEEFLFNRFGLAYRLYVESTPCFIPKPRLWKSSLRPFSLRFVLRREHDTWLSTLLVFVLIFHFRQYLTHHVLAFDQIWDVPLIVFGGLWIILKIVKKRTRLLKERLGFHEPVAVN